MAEDAEGPAGAMGAPEKCANLVSLQVLTSLLYRERGAFFSAASASLREIFTFPGGLFFRRRDVGQRKVPVRQQDFEAALLLALVSGLIGP